MPAAPCMVAASGKLKLVLARHWLIEYLDRPHWRDRKGKVNTERGSDASWHQRAFVNNMHYTTTLTKIIREDVKKKVFFGEISPKCGCMGWLIPKQGPNP